MVRRRDVSQLKSDGDSEPNPNGDVDSLRRGLEVLRLFDGRHRSLRIKDIADKLGLSRITATKLVGTLEAQNFLRLDASREAYEPHVACLALGRAVKRGLTPVRIAAPSMVKFAQRFEVHVALSTRDRLHMLLLEHCVPQGQMRWGLDTGARLPIATSASGRAYLWGQKPAVQAKIIDQLKATDPDLSARLMSNVYKGLQEMEENGWCFLAAPVTSQTSSIATVVRVHGEANFTLAAMAVGSASVERRLKEEIAPQLLTTAGEIARELEAQPYLT